MGRYEETGRHTWRYYTVWWVVFVVGLVGWFLTGYGSRSTAQEPIRIETLFISLWPEYDDPRLLVILSGTLSESGVDLRVPLPEGAQINAAAYVDAQGTLLTAAWREETLNGQRVLIVTVPTREFQVEYYVDAITSGPETVVQARIPVPEAVIGEAVVTVQEPANTEGFRGNPPLSTPQPGFNGLRYASRSLGPLSPGEIVEQEVRYTRLQPGLSVNPRPAAQPTPPSPPQTERPWLPLALGGAVALAGAIGAGYWLLRRGAETPSQGPTPSTPAAQLAKYCPNCGHPYGPLDRFCAMCGTERPAL